MFDKLERDFSRRVEEYVMSNNCGYLDAVVDISEEMNIEPHKRKLQRNYYELEYFINSKRKFKVRQYKILHAV